MAPQGAFFVLGRRETGARFFKGNAYMTLYIANTTKQNWNHHFRVLEKTRPYFVQIPSGTQQVIGHDWNLAQQDSVIRQLEKYGGRPAKDVNGKLESFPGIFFADRPISESQIVAGHEAVVDAQEKRSAAESTRSALAHDASTRDKRTRKRLASLTEVEVKQDVPARERPTGNEVSMKITVANDGDSHAVLPGI